MAPGNTSLSRPDLCFQCGSIFMTLSVLKAQIDREHGIYKGNASEFLDSSIREDSFETQLEKEFLYSQRIGKQKEILEMPIIEQPKNFNKDTINTNLHSVKNIDETFKNQIKEQVMDPWKKLLDSYKLKIEGNKETDMKNTVIDNHLGVEPVEGHLTEGSRPHESTIEKRIKCKMLKPKMSNSNEINISGKAKKTSTKVFNNKLLETRLGIKKTKSIKTQQSIEVPILKGPKKYKRMIAQKIVNGKDYQGKICMVPPKRIKIIENMVENKRRQYENKFDGYFRETLLTTEDKSPSKTTKISHKLIQSTVNKILTNDNDISTVDKKVLQELYTKVQPEKEFKCMKCPSSFKNIGSLQSHFRVDHEKRLSKKCGLCKIMFSNLSHRKEIHPKSGIASKCDSCDKVFECTYTLIKHRQGVHQGIVTQCKFCEKKISFRENMTRHMRQVHTDLRPFICDQCDLRYGDSGNLKRHKRMVHLKKMSLVTFVTRNA